MGRNMNELDALKRTDRANNADENDNPESVRLELEDKDDQSCSL
ncbi:unnamed protein product [marine sediment metagenome]|uniref:Uncharacterized protein n=1 Tax=marine sediment metagenome TaxID=412755 RepID=X1DIN7_9ZZZZ